MVILYSEEKRQEYFANPTKIIRERIAKNMSQSDISIQLGLSRIHYGNIEKGLRASRYKLAKSIADILDFGVEDLFEIQENGKHYKAMSAHEESKVSNVKKINEETETGDYLLYLSYPHKLDCYVMFDKNTRQIREISKDHLVKLSSEEVFCYRDRLEAVAAKLELKSFLYDKILLEAEVNLPHVSIAKIKCSKFKDIFHEIVE